MKRETKKKKQKTEPTEEKSFYNHVFEGESNDLSKQPLSQDQTLSQDLFDLDSRSEETPKIALKKSITKDRFYKERLKWEEEKQAREELFEQKQQRRQQLIQNFRKRKQIKQKLTRTNNKGQPLLDNLVQHYLKKLQKS